MVLFNGLLCFYYAGLLFHPAPTKAIPTWAAVFYALVALANLAAGIGLWNWRRWGASIFIVLAPVVFFVNLVNDVDVFHAACGLLGPVVLITLLRSRWEAFR